MAGVSGTITREDAMGVAETMVMMGRMPPPSRWVDELVEAAEEAQWAALV